MQVRDIMTANPDEETRRPVGIVTDRDLCCSVIARGLDPTATPLHDLMTPDPVCCRPDDAVQAVSGLMQLHQIRRVPVVDATGACCGIVAMADLARKAPRRGEAGETISEISQPSRAA